MYHQCTQQAGTPYITGFVVPSIMGATEKVLSSAERAVPDFMRVCRVVISFMAVHIYSGCAAFYAVRWYIFGT